MTTNEQKQTQNPEDMVDQHTDPAHDEMGNQSIPETENTIHEAAMEDVAEEHTHEEIDGDIAAANAHSRVTELEEELAKSKDQTMRALAELENVRRRATRDRDDAGAYGIAKFARDLLSVSDNLRRAIDAIPEDMRAQDERVASMITGIEATEKELLKAFSQNGIEKMEPMDVKFDPNYHEVMFEAPVPGKDKGTIIQLVEPGYVLKDRLLRPAKVGVAKGDDGNTGETLHIDEQA